MRFPKSVVLVCLWLLLGAAVASATVTPVGEEIPLEKEWSCLDEQLDIAGLPGGGFIAVWIAPASTATPGRTSLVARRFGAGGQPAGEATVIEDALTQRPVVAVNDRGTILIAWSDVSNGRVQVRFLDPALATLREATVLEQVSLPEALEAVALADGNFALVLTAPSPVLWRFGPTGELLGSQAFTTSGNGVAAFPRAVPHGPSGLALVWSAQKGQKITIEAKLFTPEPSPTSSVGSYTTSLASLPDQPLPTIASSRAGTLLVTWRGPASLGPAILARVYDHAGNPLGDPFQLTEWGESRLSPPAVVTDSAGSFLVIWQSLLQPELWDVGFTFARLSPRGEPLAAPQRVLDDLAARSRPLAVIDAADRLTIARQSEQADATVDDCLRWGGLFAWLFDAVPAAGPLPLQSGRFRVSVRWTDHTGASGAGHPVPLTADSGYFWFFGPDNLELMVKVLDGRAVNGHFWVFYASLSDVAYTLTVTDTATGTSKDYVNPAGQLASRGDTSTFGDNLAPHHPGSSLAGKGAGRGGEKDGVGISPAGPCFDPGVETHRRPGLCLGERFEVEVFWRDLASGAFGIGQGVRLTPDSGYLWFFGANNAELVVKVLDGRAVNGHFWVFLGALSNVEYHLTVRDTVTHAEWVYSNPSGQLASRADTSAF